MKRWKDENGLFGDVNSIPFKNLIFPNKILDQSPFSLDQVNHRSIEPDAYLPCWGRNAFFNLDAFSNDGGRAGIPWLTLKDKLLSINVEKMSTRPSELL